MRIYLFTTVTYFAEFSVVYLCTEVYLCLDHEHSVVPQLQHQVEYIYRGVLTVIVYKLHHVVQRTEGSCPSYASTETMVKIYSKKRCVRKQELFTDGQTDGRTDRQQGIA